MIKTIFFDFGNVIAFFDHWRAVNQFVRHTDMPGEELFARLYSSPLEIAFESGTIDTAEYVNEAIRDGRLNCTPTQFLEYFVEIFTPNRDVIDLIPTLAKRYRLLLASNTNETHSGHFLRQFSDVFTHFAATPTSHHAGHRKPSPEFFAYCQRFAEAEPGECLFIDDLAVNIEGGVRHGWQGLHYRAGNVLAERLKYFL